MVLRSNAHTVARQRFVSFDFWSSKTQEHLSALTCRLSPDLIALWMAPLRRPL
jgi:hypothetical protein